MKMEIEITCVEQTLTHTHTQVHMCVNISTRAHNDAIRIATFCTATMLPRDFVWKIRELINRCGGACLRCLRTAHFLLVF